MKTGIAQRVKNFFDIVDGKKAIGGNWQTVGTVMPAGDTFLHFVSIASEEDGPKFLRIRDPYLQNAWVYAAIRVMAENIAQVPFKIMKGDEEIDTGSLKYGWVYSLFQNVSPYMNKYSLFESVPIMMSTYGECFWHLIRDGLTRRQPSRIRMIHPQSIEEIVQAGEIVAWRERLPNGKDEIREKEDIIQFKYFSPYSKFRGLSPLTAAWLGLHIDYAASAYNYYFFNNDASPSGLLSTEQELIDDEADAIRENWTKHHGGLKKKGRMAVLSK